MDDTNLYEYVMLRLCDKRYTRRQVANGSGVPFSTVCKVAQRSVKDPSIHTVQALADFFRGQEVAGNERREAA